jgi:methylamine dehydrogenase accessory protein MauD
MMDALIVSNIISWIAIVVLSVLVLALARQLGVIHERIKPVGALSLGKVIEVGTDAPKFNLPSLTGGAVSIGEFNARGDSTLLFFLSASCPVCKTLIPILRDIERQEPGLRLVFASDGNDAEHQKFIEQHQLSSFPYLLSTELGMAFQISKLPYGVLIDADGLISAHGLINNREHLESLFEAKELGGYAPQAHDATVTQFPLKKTLG